MNNIDIIINDIIKQQNKNFKYNDELEYLDSLNLDLLSIFEMSFTELFKMFYVGFSNGNYNILNKFLYIMKPYFDRIDYKSYKDFIFFILHLKEMLEKEELSSLKLNEDTYFLRQKEFNNKDIPEDIKKYVIEVFTNEDNIVDYDAFNLFLSVCNGKRKFKIFSIIINIMAIQKQIFEVKEYKKISNRRKMSVFKNHPSCSPIIKNLELLSIYRSELSERKKKYDKSKNKIINNLEIVKKNINDKKIIDISKLEKIVNNDELIIESIVYNDEIKKNFYNTIKEKNGNLKNNNVSSIEKILIENNLSFDVEDIKVDINILKEKINFVKEYLPCFLSYSNILLMIINKIDLNEIEKIKYIISKKKIDKELLVNNMDMFFINRNLDVFYDNYLLLEKYNINIKNIIKSNKEIFLMNSNDLKHIINLYKSYGIDLAGEYYNYSFLSKDYTKFVDKFIEINEFELIKKNPYLLGDNTDYIIKRCLVYKSLDKVLVNEVGKLRGSLRKEENFLVNNDKLNNIIFTNYEELIDKEYCTILKNCENNEKQIEIGIHSLDKYLIDQYSYKFGNIIISKNKVCRNLNILYNNGLSNNHFNELLFYSIVYDYPCFITNEDIIFLKKLLNIKIKAKII